MEACCNGFIAPAVKECRTSRLQVTMLWFRRVTEDIVVNIVSYKKSECSVLYTMTSVTEAVC